MISFPNYFPCKTCSINLVKSIYKWEENIKGENVKKKNIKSRNVQNNYLKSVKCSKKRRKKKRKCSKINYLHDMSGFQSNPCKIIALKKRFY